IGGLRDLVAMTRRRKPHEEAAEEAAPIVTAPSVVASIAHRRRDEPAFSGPVLEARGLTKRYGGLLANRDIDFSVADGELRGIIGPNGAGKSTFFKMLTCEVQPTSGNILFHGRD